MRMIALGGQLVTEPDQDGRLSTQDRVLLAIEEAAPQEVTAVDIAEIVGGILPATASKHAFALYKSGAVNSELKPKPGYPHIVRRHYWSKE